MITNVNIETVKGCKNIECSSWQTTCKHFGDIREMPLKVLEAILIKLSAFDISNVALYGRGEALYHSDLQSCFSLVKEILPKVTTFLNVDGHSLKNVSSIPSVDYLNICHKQKIVHPPFPDLSNIPKITHSFLVTKITKEILTQIDTYIDSTISLNKSKLYAIGSLWNIEFGVPPVQGTFVPLEAEEGIEIVIPHEPVKYPRRKAYIDIDGLVRKCLFSDIIYNDIKDLLGIPGNNCNCTGCGMDVYTYKIVVKEKP